MPEPPPGGKFRSLFPLLLQQELPLLFLQTQPQYGFYFSLKTCSLLLQFFQYFSCFTDLLRISAEDLKLA